MSLVIYVISIIYYVIVLICYHSTVNNNCFIHSVLSHKFAKSLQSCQCSSKAVNVLSAAFAKMNNLPK